MSGAEKVHRVVAPDVLSPRRVTFSETYDFIVAAASLQSRSSNPVEAIVGERLVAHLLANRAKALAEVLKP